MDWKGLAMTALFFILTIEVVLTILLYTPEDKCS